MKAITLPLLAGLALAVAAPLALAQQGGGPMDHSQHMMEAPASMTPGSPPGMGGPGRGGPGGGKGAMAGMSHDMGGGMGCGMMGGGKGGGMGHMGGGKGGMMGGMGRGGMFGVPIGVTGPLSHLNLNDDQRKKILKIQDDLRRQHHETKGKIMDEQVKLRDLHFADKRDRNAIVAQYRKLGELRGQMVESSLDAQDKIEAVLTKEQKDQLRSHHPMWMMDSE